MVFLNLTALIRWAKNDEGYLGDQNKHLEEYHCISEEEKIIFIYTTIETEKHIYNEIKY